TAAAPAIVSTSRRVRAIVIASLGAYHFTTAVFSQSVQLMGQTGRGYTLEARRPRRRQERRVRYTAKKPSGGLVWSLTLCGLSAMLGAQVDKPQDSPQQRPTFRGGANFVRVDAYPVKDGVPVLDLQADEFEVREDGVPQKIETFEHVV